MREAVHLDYSACENTSLISCFSFDTALSNTALELNCSDSGRLVGGRSLCSGSLQIRDQSLNQSWAGVCEGALGRRGAEVLCRELGCGTPFLQGALSPLGQTFHCEGNESALMDCPRTRTRTSPEACPALNLTCDEPLRLLGGASRCEGNVEVKYSDEWRPVSTLFDPWDLEAVAVVCRDMDCGTVVSTGKKRNSTQRYGWIVSSACVKTAAVRDCIQDDDPHAEDMDLVCSGEV
uniref:SRCR domain-containing protein n=1 Tax=Neogobius melanostomus TaxID=47308 RepID=A0A8C6S4R0_9GOBI